MKKEMTTIITLACFLSACKTSKDYYKDGYRDGHAQGEKYGYNEGLSKGKEISYVEGHNAGYIEGTQFIVKENIVPTLGGGILIAITLVTVMLLQYTWKRFVFQKAIVAIDKKVLDKQKIASDINNGLLNLKIISQELSHEVEALVNEICSGVDVFVVSYIEKDYVSFEDVCTIRNTVQDYVPSTISIAKKLPKGYTMINGDNVEYTTVEQLSIINEKVKKIVENVLVDNERDVLINARFLQKRFYYVKNKWSKKNED